MVGWNTYTGPLHHTGFGTKAGILPAWRDCTVWYQFSHGKGKGFHLHLHIAMGCGIFRWFCSFSWKINELRQICLPSIVAAESLCRRIPGSESGMHFFPLLLLTLSNSFRNSYINQIVSYCLPLCFHSVNWTWRSVCDINYRPLGSTDKGVKVSLIIHEKNFNIDNCFFDNDIDKNN